MPAETQSKRRFRSTFTLEPKKKADQMVRLFSLEMDAIIAIL